MTKPILYGVNLSPPVRACLMTAAAINLDIEFRKVNIRNGEHRTPEYMAKNPQHTIPTLEDDGKFIWDSHAIIAYLVGKYAKDDALYPKDLYQRALIDQRLHFDSGSVFPNLRDCVLRIVVEKEMSDIPGQIRENIIQAYDFLEKFLDNNNFMVGNSMTIADLSLITTISTVQGLIPIPGVKYPKITAWIKRMKKLPYYEKTNKTGAQALITVIKDTIEKARL